MSVIELEDINVVRSGTTIVNGVSWRIDAGEHAVLLGANGSGKTTLLKVLTGYEWPTSGRVRVLDRPYGECDLRSLRRHIGWVSSAMERRFLPHETAKDVVGTGFDAGFGLYRALSRTEIAKCRDALAHFGVAALADRAFGLLSQGEQKRVLIARALVLEPALLVLDEPCAGLDPASRTDFLDDLGRFAGRTGGPTMLLVTHHVEEVRPWIRRAMTLRAGRVVKQGNCDEVFTDSVLSETFDRTCRIERAGGEWRLSVGGDPQSA